MHFRYEGIFQVQNWIKGTAKNCIAGQEMVFKVLEVRRGSRPFWDGYGNGRGSVPGIEIAKQQAVSTQEWGRNWVCWCLQSMTLATLFTKHMGKMKMSGWQTCRDRGERGRKSRWCPRSCIKSATINFHVIKGYEKGWGSWNSQIPDGGQMERMWMDKIYIFGLFYQQARFKLISTIYRLIFPTIKLVLQF